MQLYRGFLENPKAKMTQKKGNQYFIFAKLFEFEKGILLKVHTN